LPLYPKGVKVVGIDLSESMLEKARARAERENLCQVESLLVMNAQEMSFADDSFDAVVAMYVASVVPDPAQLVREIRRVCKPGGCVIFLNHFQNSQPMVQRFETLVSPLSKYLGLHTDLSLEDFVSTTGFE